MLDVSLQGKVFAAVIKLMILRVEDSLGLFRWALTPITGFLTRGITQRGINTDRNVSVWQWDHRRETTVIWPRAKGRSQPLEAGRGKEGILPRNPPKAHSPAYTLILA